MRELTIFLFVLAAAMTAVNAAEVTDTGTGIFHPQFKSLQVEVENYPYAPDVITLGEESDRIRISFDELSDERRYMRYELTHCDRYWRPDGLVDSEFIDGFNRGDVDDYRFSDAVLVHYVHYSITIPNEQMQITLPGNYLLRVYDENDPDETLLQARFGVTDNSMRAGAAVTSRTDIDSNASHQQVEVTVDTRQVAVTNPFADVTVTVTQNSRQDNSVSVSRPLRVASGRLFFEHDRKLIFDAGNEYRRFENISTRFPGLGLAEVTYQAPVYQAHVATDLPRATSGYLYDETQHGRYLVHEYNSADSDVGADYLMTHFTLQAPRMANADVFLDGDFVYRRFDPASRMVWNNATQCYEASLLLKQGSYNYQYLTVPAGTMTGSTAAMEGDYYETVNEYEIRVYHRRPGERFDRLVAVTTATSGK